MRKKQFIGLTVLGAILLIFQVSYYFYKESQQNQPAEKLQFIEASKPKILLTEFDPNTLDATQWKNLGFTEKQVATILNYKEKFCHGAFTTKEQLAKCYAISAAKFAELEPYILLSNTTEKTFSNSGKSLILPGRFNPDHLSASDWQKMGFSEKQAAGILKYKNYLGGSFQSKEKLKACYMINEQQFAQMSPYLILPDKSAEISNAPKKVVVAQAFDPNSLSKEGWMRLGFSDKQAEGILKYRDKILKGKFQTLAEIQKCYMISPEKFNELKPWIRLPEASTSTAPIAKSQQELELNSINFQQLRDFGFDERGAASYLGFRKKLGGFAKKEQILETYNLDKELAQKLINETPLNTSKVTKIDLLTADEATFKNHPYFRYYGDRIIFLRTTYPNVKDILKKLNPKPADLEKMQWYLVQN